MTIREALLAFDKIERKSIDFHEVLASLASIDDEEISKEKAKFEALAFRLVPSSARILRDSISDPNGLSQI